MEENTSCSYMCRTRWRNTGIDEIVVLSSKHHQQRLVKACCSSKFGQHGTLQNHIVQRIWVEFNARVNYPVKRALNEMSDAGAIDIDYPTHKYVVSRVAIVKYGEQILIESWNNHPIPGKDIPLTTRDARHMLQYQHLKRPSPHTKHSAAT